MKIIDAAFNRSRVIMLIFVMSLIAGASAYIAIPKESEPDIPIPIFYVLMFHEGIAPEDAERLLIRPMEKELQSIEGMKEMRSILNNKYHIHHATFQPEFGGSCNTDLIHQDMTTNKD